MPSTAPVRGLSILLAVLVAVLMVFVVASTSVEAAPVPAGSTPVGSWSYGAVRTVSVGPVTGSDGWTYEGTATFGYTVTIYDNNTSSTNFELTVFRTMGAAFDVRFCLPSCSSPTNWVNLTYRAYESTAAISNFTTQATVFENGMGVPAIGLENSTVWLQANLTESSHEHLPMLGWAVDRTRYLSAAVAGHSTVDFTPSLGLLPTSLTPGTVWNATSAFVASGSASYAYYYAFHGPVHSTIVGPIAGELSFASDGSVAVAGAYAAGSSIRFGGVTYPAITLTVSGPFSVREGVVFIPKEVDFFGGSNPAWASNASGATGADQSTLDVRPFAGGHFGLAASSWLYATDSANPADQATSDSVGSGVQPAAASSNPVSSTVIQGEPESAAQSTAGQQCLTSGSNCPSALGPAARFPFGTVVVVGAIALVGVVVVLAVVSRRRSVPPPTYPNAVLYPPGAMHPAVPAGAPPTPGAPPPPEDDPLDHLW